MNEKVIKIVIETLFREGRLTNEELKEVKERLEYKKVVSYEAE